MRRIGLGILFCLLLICLGMTYSRASWIGFILSFGFISCYLISFLSNRAKILSVIIIILSFSGLYFTLPQKMKDRAGSITRIENSSSFRINLWKESLQIIEDFPVIGIGLNTYSRVGPKYTKGEGGYYPHNSYLQLAAETGIIGLFSFLWIIIKLFKLGLHFLKDRKEPLILGLLTALLAFLIHSFFDVNLYALQLATLFWFVLGLAIASINMLTMNKSTPT
ncbi:MAG: O-antigen ligase family protein [Candidatus Omnitrophica bacterium]|nr:O-antigen ligase family protein [Candidatus Omnitrophota bacterium]